MEKETNWKYIVYCTTNIITNKIYIGVHKTQNPYKFDGYLGCGVLITQPNTYEKSKTAFQCSVKKHGVKNFIRNILYIFDSEEDAYLMEETIVTQDFLKRNDVYNMCLGGNGGILVNNRIKVFQYDLSGKFIKEFASMLEASNSVNKDYTSISYAVRKKTKSSGYFWSTDKLDYLNLDLYNIGNNNKVKVFRYLNSGNYLDEFNSIQEACKKTNFSRKSIIDSCVFGILNANQFYFSYVKEDSFDKAKTKYILSRKVFKYSLNGNFICEYETQVDAEKSNKYSNVTKAIKLKQPCENNFLWSIEKLDNFNEPITIENKKRIVGKFDFNNNLICEYPSASSAARENGNAIWHVLSGRNSTHKLHTYRYLSN